MKSAMATSQSASDHVLPALPLMGIFDADERAISPKCAEQAANTTIAQVMPVKRPLTEDEIWELPLSAVLGATGLAIEEIKLTEVPASAPTFVGMLVLPVDGEPFIAMCEGLDEGRFDLAVRGLIQRHLADPVTAARPIHLATAKQAER